MYKPSDYVVVGFYGDHYVGNIEKITDTGSKIKCMHMLKEIYCNGLAKIHIVVKKGHILQSIEGLS